MTEDQQESLDKLGNFIDFIYAELAQLTQGTYHKRKKKVFLPMYVNACDLASSAHLLLTHERVNSAENLIRSLQETWINTRFIFIDGYNLWVDAYLLESEVERLRFVRGLREVRRKYPHVKTEDAAFNDARLDRIERSVQKFKDKMASKYSSIPPIPDVSANTVDKLLKKPYTLRDKTRIIDHIAAGHIAPSHLTHSDEFQYLFVYKHLSGGAHVDAYYLARNMLRRDRTGTSILKHGNKANIQLCAWTTFALLYEISTVFSRQFGRPELRALKPHKIVCDELGTKL